MRIACAPMQESPLEGRLSATRPAAAVEPLQPEAAVAILAHRLPVAEVAEPGRLSATRPAAGQEPLQPEAAVEPNAVLSWLPDETEEQAPCGVLFCKTFSAAATAYFLGCP